MTPDPRLNFLAELREAVGLTPRAVARHFGLAERQGDKTVAAWEKGARIPNARHRARFITYLWDDLQLHRDQGRFTDAWAILVECWHWEPLREVECRDLHLPLPNREPSSGSNAPPPPTVAIDGALISGNVTTNGGDFVGRDKIIHQHGYSAEELVKIIETVQRPPSSPLPLPTAVEFQRKSFEPETIVISAGAFTMGDDSPPAAPRHTVHLPAFYIGKGLVTNRQYAEFIRATRRLAPPELAWNGQTPAADQLDAPVTGVTFTDALAYCAWLSDQTQRAYHLPHEAAWEYAASVGAITWGAAREWTCSLWGEKLRAPDPDYAYPWQDDGRNDPRAGAHLRRVLRGGLPPDHCARLSAPPDQPGAPGKRHGFRVMLPT